MPNKSQKVPLATKDCIRKEESLFDDVIETYLHRQKMSSVFFQFLPSEHENDPSGLFLFKY